MTWQSKSQGSTPLGNRIKQERLRQKMSPDALAAYVGCAPSQITGAENRGVIPHIRILAAIAITLHCSLDWLCGIEDDPGQEILKQIGVHIGNKM